MDIRPLYRNKQQQILHDVQDDRQKFVILNVSEDTVIEVKKMLHYVQHDRLLFVILSNAKDQLFKLKRYRLCRESPQLDWDVFLRVGEEGECRRRQGNVPSFKGAPRDAPTNQPSRQTLSGGIFGIPPSDQH